MQHFQKNQPGILLSGSTINILRFADDIDLLKTGWDVLRQSLYSVKAGTKAMVFGEVEVNAQGDPVNHLVIDNAEVGSVTHFIYRGSLLIPDDSDCTSGIKRWLALEYGALSGSGKHGTVQQYTWGPR